MTSPVDQFDVFPIKLFEIFYKRIDVSLTNVSVTGAFIIIFLILFTHLTSVSPKQNSVKKQTVFFVPIRGQFIIESLIKIVVQIVTDNIGNNNEAQRFIPFILSLFSVILLANLIGLLPYAFTITSHLIITFLLSFSVFIGTTIICFQKHSYKIIELFVPANTSFFLTLLLIPIEFISYISKPISLGVRLFINLMAGHCLLKVIVGFSWVMLSLESVFPLFHVLPLLVLVLLIGLEIGVAIIQAYVFTVLTCIYLNDSINLHH